MRRRKKRKKTKQKMWILAILLIAAAVTDREDISLPFNIQMVFEVCVFALICLIGLKVAVKTYNRFKYLNSSLTAIDKMEGHEFENYLEAQFRNLGYKVTNVGKNGKDFGVDLLLYRDGVKTAVQAKRYNGKVGVKAVQEIVSGREYYKADEALVVTNSYFTQPAADMARECDVILWDRSDCRSMFQ